MNTYTLKKPNGDVYTFSYSNFAMCHEYVSIVMMTDEEFMKELPRVLHFATVCCFLYKTDKQAKDALSDIGIIHQLVHLLDIPDEPLILLKEIRVLFKQTFRDVGER